MSRRHQGHLFQLEHNGTQFYLGWRLAAHFNSFQLPRVPLWNMCVNVNANSQSPPGRHSHHNVMRNVFSTWCFEAKQNTPNTHNRLKSFRYLSGIVPVSPRQPPNTSCSNSGHFDQFVFIILQILPILIDILSIFIDIDRYSTYPLLCLPTLTKDRKRTFPTLQQRIQSKWKQLHLDNKLPISTTFFSFSSDSICCRSVCIEFY
jgi:hypothetical protein